jgi:hypothetical protein
MIHSRHFVRICLVDGEWLLKLEHVTPVEPSDPDLED